MIILQVARKTPLLEECLNAARHIADVRLDVTAEKGIISLLICDQKKNSLFVIMVAQFNRPSERLPAFITLVRALGVLVPLLTGDGLRLLSVK